MRYILGLILACNLLGMDAATGVFAVPTSGTLDVGSLGFDPNLVLLRWTTTTADGDNTAYTVGYGAFTASESVALYGRQTDGSLNADSYQDTDSCIATINSSNVVTERFTCSFGTTGQNKFVITTATGGSAFLVSYTALRVTAAKIIPFQTNTTMADQAISGAGFAPDAVLMYTAGVQNTDITSFSTTYSHMGIGFAASASAEVGMGNAVLTASANDVGSQSATKMIYVPDTSAMWLEGDVKSFDSDGVTLQWTTVQGTAVAAWLILIDGVQATCGAVDQTNGTGTTDITIGQTPKVLGFYSFCFASASGQQAGAKIAIGTASGTVTESGLWSGSATSTNVADHAFDSDESILCYTAGTPTLNSKGNVTTFGSTSTITWTTADSTLRQVLWWGLGDLAGGATVPRRVLVVQ